MPAITQIKLRQGTTAEWAAANSVLAMGEPGFDATLGDIKIGDGVTPWNTLPFRTSERSKEYVSAKDHGAKGDGVNNDYWRIQEALNVAKGKPVILEGGKEYFIGGTLSVPSNTNSVTLIGTGAEPAVLKIGASGQSYPAINFAPSSTPVVTTTLAVDVGVNFDYWSVVDATGVLPGMLCMVVSSKLWYHDPRPGIGEARKSELHRVTRVLGTRVYMDDPANDGYDVSEETVKLFFYNPIKVHLENLTVKGTLPAIAEETGAVEGIIIDKADSPYIKNVNAIACARTGIRVSKSFRPLIDGGESRESNNYYNGYGASIAGCAHGTVRGRATFGSRRAIDVSSSQVIDGSVEGSIISRQTVIDDCLAVGGGTNSRGQVYGWEQDGSFGAYQGAFGSHGGADTVIYRNNRIYDMHAAFNCRGRTSIIHDNLIVGRTTGGAIWAANGVHLYVTDNRLIAGYWSLKPYFSYIPGVSPNSNQADTLVTVYANWEGNPVGTVRGQMVITGNEVEARHALVRFHQMPVGETYIANNRVRLSPATASQEVSMLDNQTGAAPLSLTNWVIGPNALKKSPAHSGVLNVANFAMTGAQVLNYTIAP